MARLRLWTGAILLVPVVMACGGMVGFALLLALLFIVALPFISLIGKIQKRRRIARTGNDWGFTFPGDQSRT